MTLVGFDLHARKQQVAVLDCSLFSRDPIVLSPRELERQLFQTGPT
jgi:hypothetical protein